MLQNHTSQTQVGEVFAALNPAPRLAIATHLSVNQYSIVPIISAIRSTYPTGPLAIAQDLVSWDISPTNITQRRLVMVSQKQPLSSCIYVCAALAYACARMDPVHCSRTLMEQFHHQHDTAMVVWLGTSLCICALSQCMINTMQPYQATSCCHLYIGLWTQITSNILSKTSCQGEAEACACCSGFLAQPIIQGGTVVASIHIRCATRTGQTVCVYIASRTMCTCAAADSWCSQTFREVSLCQLAGPPTPLASACPLHLYRTGLSQLSPTQD